MEPGIYHGISNADYHASEGLNASTIKAFARMTPKRAMAHLSRGYTSDAMALGTLVHSAVLEPDTLDQYAMIDGDGRTKIIKDAKAAALERGQTVVTKAQWDTAMRLQEAAHSHSIVADLLSEGAPEVSVYADVDGMRMRSREDWMRDEFIVDIKTTQDASPEEFSKSAWNFGYHIQAYHYLRMREALGGNARFLFVCLETVEPYDVAVYEPDENMIGQGRRDWLRGVSAYRTAQESGEYAGHPVEVQTLELPRWAR